MGTSVTLGEVGVALEGNCVVNAKKKKEKLCKEFLDLHLRAKIVFVPSVYTKIKCVLHLFDRPIFIQRLTSIYSIYTIHGTNKGESLCLIDAIQYNK